MGTIFLITRHDFDDLENHNPKYSKVEGFAGSRDAADKFVQDRDVQATHYQGYDGTIYPTWTVTPIERVA